MNETTEEYIPKHRGESLCTVCQRRPLMEPESPGLGGALCWVCFYDL